MGEVGHQILDHLHMRERGDGDLVAAIFDRGCAGQTIFAVDIHRAGSANAFAAGAAKGQRGILFRLHLDQRVEHHRPAFIGINLKCIVARILALVGVIAIDFKRPLLPVGQSLVQFAGLADLAVLGERESGHVYRIPLFCGSA